MLVCVFASLYVFVIIIAKFNSKFETVLGTEGFEWLSKNVFSHLIIIKFLSLGFSEYEVSLLNQKMAIQAAIIDVYLPVIPGGSLDHLLTPWY